MASHLANGTEIYFIDPDTPSGESIVRIACPTEISDPEKTYAEIEDTTLCDDQEQTMDGLPSYADMTITLNYDESKDSHFRLIELSEEDAPKQVLKFVVGFPDNVNAIDKQIQPTLDSNGDYDLSLDRGWRRLDATVKSVNLPRAAGQKVVGTVTLKVKKIYKTLRKGRIA